MHKKIGSIMLIAGTCMGSGMIALPMVLVKIGVLPSILVMILMWGAMYLSALVGTELNIQAGKSMTLGQLGKHFSGPIAQTIGTASIKVLSYALLAAFLYGGSSIIQKLIPSSSISQVVSCFAATAFILLIFPTQWLDYINRLLFSGLLIGIGFLIILLASAINWGGLPWLGSYKDLSVWPIIVPVVFTSFGFHGIIHTITKYCGSHNTSLLKKSFFWGSLIPVIAYIIWTSSVIGVVYHNNPPFYQQMIRGKVEVGDLVKELSHITNWPLMQGFVWGLLITKLIVSVIGVGLSLRDSLNTLIKKENFLWQNIISSAMAILPSYLIALLIPNAFISVLGFAGMILALIAIILPIYLFRTIKNPHYQELKHKSLIIGLMIIGITAMALEIFNMLHK